MSSKTIIQRYDNLFDAADIKHFNPFEFVCQCGEDCPTLVLDMGFIQRLDVFRDSVGIPFRVTSGYRCPQHPAEKEKTHPGPHQTGKAVDIAVLGASCHEILCSLVSHDFTGIGLNQKGDHDERFLHFDTCEAEPWRPRPHVWTY